MNRRDSRIMLCPLWPACRLILHIRDGVARTPEQVAYQDIGLDMMRHVAQAHPHLVEQRPDGFTTRYRDWLAFVAEKMRRN
ncbi:MAG TPA: hypothetical protein VFC53_04010 [Dehalococcoidia bacterium]|nr:hypothetical protein [Dehalococcoidia bacterium]